MDIQLRFNRDVVVVDGAMGTMLQREGLSAEVCGMLPNVLDPELIVGIHRGYRLAGAQALTTNSFGGTRAKLADYGLADRVDELNRAAVRLAKAAEPEHVLADVGPCGLVLRPLGQADFEEVFEQYAEQIAALAAEGPDAILIETMLDIADARCALLAAKSVCALPVIVSCSFDETGRMALSGTDPATAAVILEAAGASAVGMNCGLGPAQLIPLAKKMAAATSLPLIVQANAGMPQLDGSGQTYYDGTAADFAQAAEELARIGVQFIGSCCGSTPAFTSAIYASVGGMRLTERAKPPSAAALVCASPTATVVLGGGEKARMIGERINPTGKPELAAELEQGSMSELLRLAETQAAAGADLLDVNVGAPMVDARSALPAASLALQGLVSCPLVFDTTDYDALEAALRSYPGRALINSVNGDEESYGRVFPLARRYGAAVVVLALDRQGIPRSVEERLAIVERVRTEAHRCGLADSDLIFDMLTMTAASDPSAPETTLEGVRRLSEQGLATVLGVSNVSHGLPDRAALNAAFLSAAIAAGLSAAIANPNDPIMLESLRSSGIQRKTQSLDEAREQWRTVFARVMERAAGGEKDGLPESQNSLEEAPVDDPQALLGRAVLRGDREAVPMLVDAVIEGGMPAAQIVEKLLTPLLEDLGEAFARGEAFLPQMMLAAGAMKAAVGRIRERLAEEAKAQEEALGTAGTPATGIGAKAAGKVLFCTVKGDAHSIGKDICVALLESQGFEVYDLGVDVAPEEVVEVARANDVDVICLSALMTTTLQNMKETVERVYAELPAFAAKGSRVLAVGGAVVTERWAQSVGAAYGADAPACVRIAQAAIKA